MVWFILLGNYELELGKSYLGWYRNHTAFSGSFMSDSHLTFGDQSRYVADMNINNTSIMKGLTLMKKVFKLCLKSKFWFVHWFLSASLYTYSVCNWGTVGKQLLLICICSPTRFLEGYKRCRAVLYTFLKKSPEYDSSSFFIEE